MKNTQTSNELVREFLKEGQKRKRKIILKKLFFGHFEEDLDVEPERGAIMHLNSLFGINNRGGNNEEQV